MANQGVIGFYQITKTIKDQLLDDINVQHSNNRRHNRH